MTELLKLLTTSSLEAFLFAPKQKGRPAHSMWRGKTALHKPKITALRESVYCICNKNLKKQRGDTKINLP
jgi:hypothetical protein